MAPNIRAPPSSRGQDGGRHGFTPPTSARPSERVAPPPAGRKAARVGPANKSAGGRAAVFFYFVFGFLFSSCWGCTACPRQSRSQQGRQSSASPSLPCLCQGRASPLARRSVLPTMVPGPSPLRRPFHHHCSAPCELRVVLCSCRGFPGGRHTGSG